MGVGVVLKPCVEEVRMVCVFVTVCFSDVFHVVPCPSLADPNNGTTTCSLGDGGVPSYEDTCSFTCNTGYELTGSDTRACQSDGSWSGDETICTGKAVLQTASVQCVYQNATHFLRDQRHPLLTLHQ